MRTDIPSNWKLSVIATLIGVSGPCGVVIVYLLLVYMVKEVLTETVICFMFASVPES
jgi:hypothetical protein